MKKAIMLKFLFYAILAFVIFIPTVLFASKFLNLSHKGMDSFTALASIISSQTFLDGETRSIALYMDTESLILGFSKESLKFENYDTFFGKGQTLFAFEKPKECITGQACICLCSGYQTTSGSLEYPLVPKCEKLRCKSFEYIDFKKEKTEQKTLSNPSHYWKGGFILARNVDLDVHGTREGKLSTKSGISQERATRTLYIERAKGIVDVCFETPCFEKLVN